MTSQFPPHKSTPSSSVETPTRRRIYGFPPAMQSSSSIKDIPSQEHEKYSNSKSKLILFTVFIIATCGLIYELLASTLASYVLGDAVTQYSTVIGVYLSAMGVGAYLSRFVGNDSSENDTSIREVAQRFIDIEIAVALLGGVSAPLLFFAFAHVSWFRIVLYSAVLFIGTLVGMEIPLLLRILRAQYSFKELVAHVLTVDYIGALIGSLAFPIFFVPKLGLVRTSLVVGIINAFVGFASTWLLSDHLSKKMGLRVRAALVTLILLAGIFNADKLTLLAEDGLYADDIIYAKQTQYQRIVLTRGKSSFQLFLNGNLQFSSADEYRYHEALVWPAVSVRYEQQQPIYDVLILGGGDGLALREVRKIPELRSVTLVDLDPEMTAIAKKIPLLRELNEHAFDDSRVTIHNTDAYVWLGDLQNRERRFDIIVADFPDPNHYSLGKLYSTRIYKLMKQHLNEDGVLVVQSTSPLFARKSFWCIAKTIEKAGFFVAPYHAMVPSFGEWGFVLAQGKPFRLPTKIRPLASPLKFLDDATQQSLFVLSQDMSSLDVEVNRLDNQVLVHYYESEWKRLL